MTARQERLQKRVAIYAGPAAGRILPDNPLPDIFEARRYAERRQSWDLDDIEEFYDTSTTSREARDLLCEEVQSGRFTDVICFAADRIGDPEAVDRFKACLSEHGVKLHVVQRPKRVRKDKEKVLETDL